MRSLTYLSNGELYTIVTNRDRHGGECSLVAVVSGTKSEDVIKALETIPEDKREKADYNCTYNATERDIEPKIEPTRQLIEKIEKFIYREKQV